MVESGTFPRCSQVTIIKISQSDSELTSETVKDQYVRTHTLSRGDLGVLRVEWSDDVPRPLQDVHFMIRVPSQVHASVVVLWFQAGRPVGWSKGPGLLARTPTNQ